ncbi:MAG: exosortase/archaeosortase family protein, partial [Planctomycetota bacterium]
MAAGGLSRKTFFGHDIERGAAFAFAALLLVAFGPTLAELVREWIDRPEYSHGFLMPPVAAWMVWTRRRELAALRRDDSARASFPLLLAAAAFLPVCVLLLAGEMKISWYLKPYALLASLAIGVWILLGANALWRLAPPLVVLFLMCPLPGRVHLAITLPLKKHAAVLATGLLDLSGLEATLEGNLIHLPGVDKLYVADACSGIRSLISLTSVAILACFFWRRHWILKAVVIASCPPIAVVVNGLRIWTTGMLSAHVSPQAAQGFFHFFEGFLLFGVGALVLLGWARVLGGLAPSR